LTAALAAAGCGGDGEAAEVCLVPGDGPGFDPSGELCEQLSSYRLFDDLPAQAPAAGVQPYELNTALFSDYTVKYRFLHVPDGEAMTWDDEATFDMPVGTIIAKTFGYLEDRRDPDGPVDLLETRLLLHRADGWESVSYVYDDDDREARLAVAGATVATSWIHDDGEVRTNAYLVPNKNQCKNCHEELDDVVAPIGPKARHVNRDGQLERFIDAGILAGAPTDQLTWPRTPVFDDPATGTLDQRVRGWLEINCAHCHNPDGAARTSGLDLRVAQTTPFDFGVCKPPVAAGGGSGGLPYAIVPGDPDQSILVYRLASTDPGVMMPELGRNLVHDEAVALIRQWIEELPGDCASAP
jgi:uncharacterized repeat protein (TIGR03806 family)